MLNIFSKSEIEYNISPISKFVLEKSVVNLKEKENKWRKFYITLWQTLVATLFFKYARAFSHPIIFSTLLTQGYINIYVCKWFSNAIYTHLSQPSRITGQIAKSAGSSRNKQDIKFLEIVTPHVTTSKWSASTITSELWAPFHLNFSLVTNTPLSSSLYNSVCKLSRVSFPLSYLHC